MSEWTQEEFETQDAVVQLKQKDGTKEQPVYKIELYLHAGELEDFQIEANSWNWRYHYFEVKKA